MVRTHVGYQPTGIKPCDLLSPGSLTSNTARQLLSAFAMYKVFSSALKATLFVVEPGTELGYKAALSVSITLRWLILITDTLLSLALATYNHLPFFDKHISLGLSPTATLSTIFFDVVLKTFTLSPPQTEMYNSFLSGDNKHV